MDDDGSTPVRLNAALEGRDRIERELGEGGMATAYLAEDIRHDRNVALKVLKPAVTISATVNATAGAPAKPHIGMLRALL